MTPHQKTMTIIGSIGTFMALIIFIFACSWCSRTNDLAQEKFFAPKEEDARRETFEHSKAYRDGMAQELYQMQTDYVKANTDQKLALKSIILHRVAEIDVQQLPTDLQQFISSLRSL